MLRWKTKEKKTAEIFHAKNTPGYQVIVLVVRLLGLFLESIFNAVYAEAVGCQKKDRHALE